MLWIMRAYSLDLRERIVAARQEGQSEKQVADRFGVSEATVTRYHRLARQQKPLAAKYFIRLIRCFSRRPESGKAAGV